MKQVNKLVHQCKLVMKADLSKSSLHDLIAAFLKSFYQYKS